MEIDATPGRPKANRSNVGFESALDIATRGRGPRDWAMSVAGQRGPRLGGSQRGAGLATYVRYLARSYIRRPRPERLLGGLLTLIGIGSLLTKCSSSWCRGPRRRAQRGL